MANDLIRNQTLAAVQQNGCKSEAGKKKKKRKGRRLLKTLKRSFSKTSKEK